MPLIILEGPDGAGKTRLMQDLVSYHGYKEVMARENTKDQTAEEMCLKLSFAMAKSMDGEKVVLDRCWLSELIYAPRVRHERPKFYPYQLRMLERIAFSSGGVKLVRCDPGFELCFENYASRKGEEYIKDDDTYTRVYAAYRELQHKTSLKVLRYDYRDNNADLIADFPPESETLHKDLYGCSDAATLVLAFDKYEGATVPCINWKFESVSARITRCFEEANIPESDLAWVNVAQRIDLQGVVDALQPERILSIGQQGMLAMADVVSDADLIQLPVPARFDANFKAILDKAKK